MKTKQLIISSEYCCACGACRSVCKQNAIKMETDAFGFSYPVINEDLCIDCGLCKKVCAFQNSVLSGEPESVYGAKTKATDISKSSSGGAFACIADDFISRGGIVYGAAMEIRENVLTTCHIRVFDKDGLSRILTSKYVQSEIGDTYKQVKADLELNELVLFSGTPCQIDGLYGYLQKDYKNLFTIDIICHGVPNSKMLNDWIKTLETKGSINSFTFRTKDISGEKTIKTVFENGNTKYIPCNASPYYFLFMNGYISRDSCYSCKYACKSRRGDITLGDFWGIEKEHPEFDSNGDVSCILINTDKGKALFENNKNRMEYINSNFTCVAKHNVQLNHPSEKPEQRESVLNAYKTGGWAEVEKQYKKIAGNKIYISKAKLLVKKILNHLKKR